MACYEISFIDIIRTLDGLIAETKMGDSDTACLLRVVLEICLNEFIGMVADNLDGILVCADCSVAAETPEFTFDSTLGRGVGSFFLLKRKERNVVVNSDCELLLGLVLFKLVVNGEYACGGSIL